MHVLVQLLKACSSGLLSSRLVSQWPATKRFLTASFLTATVFTIRVLKVSVFKTRQFGAASVGTHCMHTSAVLVLRCSIGVILLLVLSACKNNDSEPTTSSDTIGLFTDQTINVAGQSRNYHLYLPENPASASIVFLLHGNSGSADQLLGLTRATAPYKVWLTLAANNNVILVVPDGLNGSNNKQGWNDCRTDASTNPDSNDVEFLSSLLDAVQAEHSTANAAVFSVGTSNGGMMTLRLAQEMPERLSGIAVVVASKALNTECIDSRVPLPLLIMNGTDDPILPYEGGQIDTDRGVVLSTGELVDYWLNRNQANSTPMITQFSDTNTSDNSTVTRFSYKDGSDNSLVEHYEIVNGGHTEPSELERYGNLFKRIVGNQNGDFEMADEIWHFFSLQVSR